MANTNGSGTWTAGLAELIPNTTYYARAYGISGSNTFYGNEIIFTTSNSLGPGDYYPEQGGVIFYTLQAGDPEYDPDELHGLIVSIEYNGTYSYSFGCDGSLINGTSQDIFTGQNNTNLILGNCSNPPGANACNNLVSLGFDDWYLPSVGELSLLYQRKANVNATLLNINSDHIVSNDSHMSSSEKNEDEYFVFIFYNGTINDTGKNLSTRVRAIRTF